MTMAAGEPGQASVFSIEHDSPEAAGAWFSDEGIAIQTWANAADAPSTTVSSALCSAVPI